jgi:hypothetical protein
MVMLALYIYVTAHVLEYHLYLGLLKEDNITVTAGDETMASDTEAPSTFAFHHAQLGPMTGIITPEHVVQFRAVPFAMIPARFKQSIQKGSLEQTNRDFTQMG